MREAISSDFIPVAATRKQTAGGLVEVLLSSRRLLVVVFMLVIFTVATRPITDPDFWWHLKTGQHLVENRSIPHTDPFSTTRLGSEWVTHEWLSEIFMYSVYRALGYGGLIIVFSAIITAAFWIGYRRFSKFAGHPYVSGFALLLGAMAAGPVWGVRPQMFSFLFASVYVVVLDDYARDGKRRSLWWLVPLMILWVNMHAGFPVGLALILLTIVGLALEGILSRAESFNIIWRRVRPLLLVGILCGAAVLLNPHGARMYLYPIETLRSHAMMKYIDEWLSPNFHELMFQPLLLLLFATFSMLALSSKRVRLLHMVLLVATAAGALRSARNLPFFVLMAMPLLAEHSWNWITAHRWGQWLTRPEKREVGSQVMLKIALNLALLVALPVIVAAVRVNHSVAKQSAAEAREFPAAAVEFMRAQKPPQPIFNEYGWGGYLIWKLYPDYRVYIDGRADVYGDAFMEEFLLALGGATAWRETLDKYGVRTVLVKPQTALASLLRQEGEWQKVFEDQQAVIFVRR